MTCKACGEEPHKCNCKNHDSCMSPAVLEIVNNPEFSTFCKVVIPASAGDEKTNPPLPGLYRNVLLSYEATGEAYLYSSDGIPTKLTDRDTIERLNQLIASTHIRIDGVVKMVDDEREERAAEDAKLQKQINDIVISNVPVASATTLGGIKVGDNLTITEDGVLSAVNSETSVAWGEITGNLADQADLSEALNSKASIDSLNAETQARTDAESALSARIDNVPVATNIDRVYTTPTKVGKYNGRDVWRVSVSLSGVRLPVNRVTTVASNLLAGEGWVDERTLFVDCTAYLSDSTVMKFQARTPHIATWENEVAFIQASASLSVTSRGIDLAIYNYKYGISGASFLCDSRSYITVDFVSVY